MMITTTQLIAALTVLFALFSRVSAAVPYTAIETQAYANATIVLDTSATKLIDTFIANRAKSHTTDRLIDRIPEILDRIDDIMIRSTMTPRMNAVLVYIDQSLQDLLTELLLEDEDDEDTDEDDENGTGDTTFNTALPDVLTGPERFTTTQLIVGGETTALNQRLVFTVSTEDIIIHGITLTSSSTSLDSFIDEIGLYDEDMRLIAVASPVGNNITFRNIDQQLDIGSHTRYLSIIAHQIWRGEAGAAGTFSLSVQEIDAEGATTRRDINPTIQTNISTTVTIAPVAISEVRFVDTWSSYRTDEFLVDGETTLGLLEIETVESENTSATNAAELDIVLDRLTITLNDTTTAKTVATKLRLQRLDTLSTTIAGAVSGTTVIFDLGNFNDQRDRVEAGDTAVFRIIADVDLDPTRTETVQLSLRNLQSGAITYHSSDSSTTFTAVQQRESEVFGDTIRD